MRPRVGAERLRRGLQILVSADRRRISPNEPYGTQDLREANRGRSGTGRACVKTRTGLSVEQFNFLQAPIDREIPGTEA
jgi:hypothetical protein